MSTILVIPDTHFPASSRQLIEWAAKVRDAVKPDKIIQLGDLCDAKAWSRFPKSSTDDSAALEWDKTEKQAALFHKHFPEITILSGNHDVRAWKKAIQDAGLPPKFLKSFTEIFGHKGWHFYDKNTPLTIDGVSYIHGDEIVSPLGLIASRMGKSVVRGHTHQAGIIYSRFFDNQLFAMECGMLADEKHGAFGYAAKNPRRCWVGVGVVEDGENPQLISYY